MSATTIIDRLRAGRGTPPPADEARPENPELEARRKELEEQLATLQWDLGGLTYEMAIRDHFRLDVLVKTAAKLQEVDAELAEAERLLRLEGAGAAGACTSCGALHARGATFCWQCGTRLMESAEAATIAAFTTPSPGLHTAPPSHTDDRADVSPLTQENA
jgi:hypothetical protein